MTDGNEISEEGRRVRFEQWEGLGLDRVKHDLLNGGHRLVGGSPQVRKLAWEWVRMKEAEAAKGTTSNTNPPAANEAGYTMDAERAVYAAIEGLVSAGTRAYSLSVPMEAENILVKEGGGRINPADANRQIKAAIVGLSQDGKIEAHIEQHKDWLIKEPLLEEPTVHEASPALTSQAALPAENRAEILTLKPTIWGIGLDLKEAWRRLRAWARPS